MEKILFYHETDAYGYLSNYWTVDIEIDGLLWKSTEHYYQAEKTLDEKFAAQIRDAATCDEAKTLGNSEECIYRPDWETEKIEAMRRALKAKFGQHDDLRTLLLNTGDATLIEDSPTDYYWGIGATGDGKNMLGTLLMELRDSYRKAENRPER